VYRLFTAVVRDEDLNSVKFKIQLYAIWCKERKRKHDEITIVISNPVLRARPEKTKQNVDGFLLSKGNSHLSCSDDAPSNVKLKRKRTNAAK
jgi:hypothetical protein